MSERPTPDTDVFIASQNHSPTTHQLRNFARILERERDEAREDAARWESSFDAIERAGAEQARRADENREWALKAEKERDEARDAIRVLAEHGESEIQRITKERDEAREIAKEADVGHDMAIADLAKCEAAAEKMVVRANELIARWDQPSWKDTAPTARFVNALRIAVRAYERET